MKGKNSDGLTVFEMKRELMQWGDWEYREMVNDYIAPHVSTHEWKEMELDKSKAAEWLIEHDYS